MKCIIIEDELPAQKIIKNFISRIPYMDLAGSFQTALSAHGFLKNNIVDVVFLDINLPDISGIDFIKTIINPPQIIMTTAYSEYALDSFELDTIVDYLVKPFSFDRFLKAIKKVESKMSKREGKEKTIFINVDKTLHKLNLGDILFLESDRNYISIITKSKKYVLIESLKNWKTKLPTQFVQVHKSYLVNIDVIEKVFGNMIFIIDYKIPIGRAYKSCFLEKIKQD